MKIHLILFGTLLSLLAIGCNPLRPVSQPLPPSGQNSQSQSLSPAGLEQKTITVGNQQLLVEIADTSNSQALGLSHRQSLQTGHGMLFDFSTNNFKRPSFWMKDMQFDIDIIWINQNQIVEITKNIPAPQSNNNLPTYSPREDITHVLEVPSGWSDDNKIKILDFVSL